MLQQQERFDEFVEEFNTQRPHQAIDMKRPADLYVPSAKKHPTFLPDPDYSTHDAVLRVGPQGLIHFAGRRQVYLSKALAGQLVGVREEGDDRWLVSFMHLDLGYVEPRCHHFTQITSASPPAAS